MEYGCSSPYTRYAPSLPSSGSKSLPVPGRGVCVAMSHQTSHLISPSFLSYFTELSYIGLTAYYWAAAVQTLFYARYNRYLLQRWPRPLQALHVLLQSTIVSFRAFSGPSLIPFHLPFIAFKLSNHLSSAAFIVTIFFWALLSSPSTLSTTYSSASISSQYIAHQTLRSN